jgi:hypothetical protein
VRIGFVSAAAGQGTTTLDDIVAEAQRVEADGFVCDAVPSISRVPEERTLTGARWGHAATSLEEVRSSK